jgi:hypothetical protein
VVRVGHDRHLGAVKQENHVIVEPGQNQASRATRAGSASRGHSIFKARSQARGGCAEIIL